MIDLNPTFQTLLTFFGFAGAVAVVWATLRSRLPNETIKIQTESIAALQKSHEINSAQIKELSNKVIKLQAENDLLKNIPLGDIKITQEKILHLLETQNTILSAMSEKMSPAGGSIVFNS